MNRTELSSATSSFISAHSQRSARRGMLLALALGLAAMSGCDREQPSFKESEAEPHLRTTSLSRTFVFAERQQGQQDLNITTNDSRQKVTLDMATEAVVWSNAQRDRRVMDSFRQGSSSSEATESFKNLEKSPVDILFVVDTSSSMKQEQEQLASKLSAVVGHIDSADWRLAVVSADANDHCSRRRVIKKESANPAREFAQAINDLGLDGDNTEKGILMAVNGLKLCEQRDGSTTGWLRANSAVATVIVSDEDNCSNGRDCGREPYGKARYLTDYLDSIRTLGTTAKVYGIIKRNRRECRSARHIGRQYLQAIEATGGIAGSICASDYSEVLSNLSKDLSETLIHNLNLSHTPIGGGAVTVWVDDKPLSRSQYRISGSTIVLNQPLKAGQLAKVRYTYRPEPLKTSFALSQKPRGRTVAVAINGTASDNFRVTKEGGVHYVTFDNPPPADAKIVARYRNDVKLKKTFVFDQPMGVKRDLKVFVNGAQVNSYDIEARRWETRVTFDTPPEDGAQIKVSFARELGRKLRYPLPVVAGELKGVHDVNTGSVVDGWLEDEGRTFVVAEDQFEVGRQIVLDFRMIAGVTVKLPEAIDLATLKIERDGQQVCQDLVDIADRSLDLVRCHRAIGDGMVQVSYTRQVDGHNFLFAWPDIESRGNNPLEAVTVTVNEQAFTNFKVEADGIRFLSPLSNDDRVYVRCDYAKGQ